MHRVLSYSPEPELGEDEVAARLATPWRRFKTHAAFLFLDHHLLRLGFQNAHLAGPDMWRSNQPSPRQLEIWAQKGVKTVVNLRGVSGASFHVLERDACRRLGLELVTCRVNSRDVPWPPVPRQIKAMFDTIRYPALMHCKSGADRAGLMGVFFRHFREGLPIAAAREQLGLKYLHIRAGKTGILDAYFEAYLAQGEPKGLSIIDWSETRFDPVAFKAGYRSTALGRFLVDRVLGRE